MRTGVPYSIVHAMIKAKEKSKGAKVAGGRSKGPGAAAVAPAIILVEPQLGENIGFAARAMANFGLSELRLVAPRDGWPSEKAKNAASGAPVLDEVKSYPSVSAATGDLNFVLVEHMDEVIEHALRPVVKRKGRTTKKPVVRSKKQK